MHLNKKILSLSVICSKSKNEDEKISKEEKPIEILKILGLTENIWLLYVWAKNLSMNQKFRLKNIDETRNCLLEEIKQNALMSWRHKKVFTTLNYIEHSLILASTITRCISISAFASLLDIAIGITSSAIELKIWAITAWL